MKGLGLIGAHRTGKTTMLQAITEYSGLPAVETQSSAIFRREGVDPAEPMTPAVRLRMQGLILDDACDRWEAAACDGQGFVSDRTPIDMATYTLVHAGSCSDFPVAPLREYIARCLVAARQHFGAVVLVQPGIPVIAAEGKAKADPAYMELLNATARGLMEDAELPVSVAMPRDVLDLSERVRFAVGVYHGVDSAAA